MFINDLFENKNVKDGWNEFKSHASDVAKKTADTIVSAGSAAGDAVSGALNAIPKPFDEKTYQDYERKSIPKTDWKIQDPKKKPEPLESLDEDLPPPENARKTQIASTLGTYKKAGAMFDKAGVQGKALDFGAGLGKGTAEIGKDAESYEPYPREDFKPHYIDATKIPSNSYSRIVNLNVLNVVPNVEGHRIRDEIVRQIGRVLAPGGMALITTRGRDVLTIKGTPGEEPMSMISSIGTYQKGFTGKELKEYVQSVLGDNFEVSTAKLGPAGVMIKKHSESLDETSARDKLHQRHQTIRKQAGRPHPDYYKELKTTFDLPDDQRWAKTAEIKKKYNVAESLRDGEHHTWTVHFDDGTSGKINVQSDETTTDQIKTHYAKKGKTVVKVDKSYGIGGQQTDAPRRAADDAGERADRERKAHIAHDRSLTEGSEEELANEVYTQFEMIYPNLARRANQSTVHAAIMDVLNYGGDNDPVALAQDVARAVKQEIQQGVAEGTKEVDMTGKKCSACKKGTYQETSQHDDMDGVLHCTKCNKQVNRWKNYKEQGVAEGDDQFSSMMSKIASPESMDASEALALIDDLMHQAGASYQEAVQQASVSYGIKPAKLNALYKQRESRDAFDGMFGGGNPASKLGIKEEQLDELSPKTLMSYSGKAQQDAQDRITQVKSGAPNKKELISKAEKRVGGIKQAHSKAKSARGVAEDINEDIERYVEALSRAGYEVNEEWSKKYKDSINCSNPKGFSQKAHCAGKQKNEEVSEEKVRLDPKCWSGKKIGNPKTKMKGGVRVNNCVPK